MTSVHSQSKSDEKQTAREIKIPINIINKSDIEDVIELTDEDLNKISSYSKTMGAKFGDILNVECCSGYGYVENASILIFDGTRAGQLTERYRGLVPEGFFVLEAPHYFPINYWNLEKNTFVRFNAVKHIAELIKNITYSSDHKWNTWCIHDQSSAQRINIVADIDYTKSTIEFLNLVKELFIKQLLNNVFSIEPFDTDPISPKSDEIIFYLPMAID